MTTPTDPTTGIRVRWSADASRGVVQLLDPVPAGDYSADVVARFAGRLTTAAARAGQAAGIAKWLTEAGCTPEQVTAALELLRTKGVASGTALDVLKASAP